MKTKKQKASKKNPLAGMTIEDITKHCFAMGFTVRFGLDPKPEPFTPFAMLYAEGKAAPTVKHNSFTDAFAEAKRLVSIVGKPVFILQSIGCISPEPQKFKFIESAKVLPISPQPPEK